MNVFRKEAHFLNDNISINAIDKMHFAVLHFKVKFINEVRRIISFN